MHRQNHLKEYSNCTKWKLDLVHYFTGYRGRGLLGNFNIDPFRFVIEFSLNRINVSLSGFSVYKNVMIYLGIYHTRVRGHDDKP